MTIDFTTTALVRSIKRRGYIPAGSGLSSEDILQYASEELRSYITAFLKGIREEFIINTLDLSVSDGVVSAPARAVGGALRTIGWLKSDGKVKFLDRVEPENAGGYAGQTGEPTGYMFQGNDCILLPAPTSGTIRLAYQQRPGQLVVPGACGLVTEVDELNGTITVAVAHSDWADDDLFDIVSGSPNFVALGLDLTFTGANSTELTFDEAMPDGVAVGDYVCLAGETCIPQVPTEVHDLLAQQTAFVIADATGSARLAAIEKALDRLEKQMTMILSPRTDGSARAIISNSRLGRWNVGY